MGKGQFSRAQAQAQAQAHINLNLIGWSSVRMRPILSGSGGRVEGFFFLLFIFGDLIWTVQIR